jgi:hypothetical protein
MSAYLLICGDMYWRTTFSFLDFIMDNVMLDLKCTLVWNTVKASCGTSSVIMRSNLLSNHLDVIGNLHHTSAEYWRFSTKLSSSICIQGSLSGMPQGLEIALHALFIQFLWRTFFAFI